MMDFHYHAHLEGLAEPHLVREDAVDAVGVGTQHPVKPGDLQWKIMKGANRCEELCRGVQRCAKARGVSTGEGDAG